MTGPRARYRARLTSDIAPAYPTVERRSAPRTSTVFNCLQSAVADLHATMWSK